MATISKTEEDLRTAICDKAEDGVNTAYSIGNDEGTKTALSPAEDDNNLKTQPIATEPLRQTQIVSDTLGFALTQDGTVVRFDPSGAAAPASWH